MRSAELQPGGLAHLASETLVRHGVNVGVSVAGILDELLVEHVVHGCLARMHRRDVDEDSRIDAPVALAQVGALALVEPDRETLGARAAVLHAIEGLVERPSMVS